MNAQFKKGIVEVCLLTLVEKGYQSAYQLSKAMKDDLEVTENTVYPMLRRLTEKNLLTYEKEKSPAGAPVKKFVLTPSGIEHLEKEKEAWHQFIHQIANILGDTK